MSRKQRERRARARAAAQPSSGPSGAKSNESPPVHDTPAKGGGSINRLGLIFATAVLAGLFGLVLFLGEPPPPSTTGSDTAGTIEVTKDPERSPLEEWRASVSHEVPVSPGFDFVWGPEDAPVTIVEFSDFQCPFCKSAAGSLRAVIERYPSDVRLVYKNFPLDLSCNPDMVQQLHPWACKAAVMARCAGKRDPDLFWRFHDAIFARDDLTEEILDAIAAELGVAGESFHICVNDGKVFDEVRTDVELAASLGLTATPTLFVNDRVAPSYDVGALSQIIDYIVETN